jgi:hypothetical protein
MKGLRNSVWGIEDAADSECGVWYLLEESYPLDTTTASCRFFGRVFLCLIFFLEFFGSNIAGNSLTLPAKLYLSIQYLL